MDEWLSDLIKRRESDSPPGDAEIDRAFQELAQHIADEIEHAQEAPGTGSFGGLENRISATKRDLGKSVRALTASHMWEVITRLREGQPLLEPDRFLVRLWLIGDAEAYVKEENNVDDWRDELNRLRAEIASMSSAVASPESLQALHALLADAHNFIINISRWHNERERVERFERTMSDRMTDHDRNMLADVLVAAYYSRNE